MKLLYILENGSTSYVMCIWAINLMKIVYHKDISEKEHIIENLNKMGILTISAKHSIVLGFFSAGIFLGAWWWSESPPSSLILDSPPFFPPLPGPIPPPIIPCFIMFALIIPLLIMPPLPPLPFPDRLFLPFPFLALPPWVPLPPALSLSQMDMSGSMLSHNSSPPIQSSAMVFNIMHWSLCGRIGFTGLVMLGFFWRNSQKCSATMFMMRGRQGPAAHQGFTRVTRVTTVSPCHHRYRVP